MCSLLVDVYLEHSFWWKHHGHLGILNKITTQFVGNIIRVITINYYHCYSYSTTTFVMFWRGKVDTLTALPRCCCRKCRNFDSCNAKKNHIQMRIYISFLADSSFQLCRGKMWRSHQLKLSDHIHILLLHDWVGNWEVEGQGAGMLSFKSQRKLIPEDWSNVTSDGKLGKRHPDSIKSK